MSNLPLEIGPGAVGFLQERLRTVRAGNRRLLEALRAAREYIEYTHQAYHHDTIQDDLYQRWQDAIRVGEEK